MLNVSTLTIFSIVCANKEVVWSICGGLLPKNKHCLPAKSCKSRFTNSRYKEGRAGSA